MAVLYRRTKGDTYVIKAELMNNGAAVDLTGYNLSFNFKNQKAEGSIAGVIQGLGQVNFTPTALDFSIAGEYKFNIKATKDAEVITYVKGTLLVEEDL